MGHYEISRWSDNSGTPVRVLQLKAVSQQRHLNISPSHYSLDPAETRDSWATMEAVKESTADSPDTPSGRNKREHLMPLPQPVSPVADDSPGHRRTSMCKLVPASHVYTNDLEGLGLNCSFQVPCNRSKVKCHGKDNPPCERCRKNGFQCTFKKTRVGEPDM